MKHIMLSIYDSATEAYMRPFTAQSEGQALRMFTDEAQRQDSEIGKHPQDYSLFKIGEFNDATGTLSPEDFRCIGRAHELIGARPNPQQSAIAIAYGDEKDTIIPKSPRPGDSQDNAEIPTLKEAN